MIDTTVLKKIEHRTKLLTEFLSILEKTTDFSQAPIFIFAVAGTWESQAYT